MKKLLLMVMLLASATALFAQNKIKEGYINYGIEWQLPEHMQAYAAMFPQQLTVFFKGDSASWKNQNQMSTTVTITNTRTNFTRLLLDIPLMGKKVSITLTPSDIEKMKGNWPEFTLSEGSESKNIAGFKSRKHLVTETKSGTTTEAWFTKDIQVTPNSFTQYFDAKYGFPVEFNTYANGLGIKAIVKEVKEGSVPAGSFSATKDYEPMSFEELMEMQGGAQ